MKIRLSILGVLATYFFIVEVSAQVVPLPQIRTKQPTIVHAPITQIYTPKGFDDNDVAQVFVEGAFPDTCYRVQEVTKEYLPNRRIKIDVYALHYPGTCPPSRTVYLESVDLKVLPHGNYEIVHTQNQETPIEQTSILTIKHTSREERDDFPYAPVDSMTLQTERNGKRYITLIGFHESNQWKQDFINQKVIGPEEGGQPIIVVLPVVERAYDRKQVQGAQAFAYKLEIPSNIPNGRYLFHIRTADGKSFNKVAYLGYGSSQEATQDDFRNLIK